ncbi:MAG: DUF3662 and FHA domain-containing protein [Gaiellales bacterium]
MSVLRAIERSIEGLFEGVFGRAFRAHVQPVEIARKLAKEMDQHRSVSVSRVYAPNEYDLYLCPSDREQFASYEGSLVGELQEYLAEHARREGYALLTPPRVIVHADPDLAIGEFGIATRMVEPDPSGTGPRTRPARASVSTGLPAAADTPSHTTIYRPETPLAPEPESEPVPRVVATVSIGGRQIALNGTRVLIGRSSDCAIRLEDGNVSRRHCELVGDGVGWSLVDLGSTNGTELNGRVVDRAPLTSGDRITVGGTDLVFELTNP